MGFPLVDEETQESTELMGHPIHGYTDGFHLMGRWIRLARGCVGNLHEHASVPAASNGHFWARTGLLAVLPAVDSELLLTEPEDDIPAVLRDNYLLPLHRMLGLPIPEANLRLFPSGHVGTSRALKTGLQQLEARDLEQLLVVAVDSLFDPLVLNPLADVGRLKHGDQPTGLMPGEAGVCLLVEREAGARRREVAAESLITAVATRQEVPAFCPGQPNTGEALAACIRDVLEQGLAGGIFQGDVYSDLNGEEWRAREWGGARVRLEQRLSRFHLHLPCNSVGDVGAASGALGVCLASHAMVDRQGARALVISSAVEGAVGGILLQTAEP
ncbi:hypothetical protein [Melittangium boletus]|uniref:hypothetical protein n=1 Tax=Melittangium boletus TaxID=83453 RepID=UPI003DA635BE